MDCGFSSIFSLCMRNKKKKSKDDKADEMNVSTLEDDILECYKDKKKRREIDEDSLIADLNKLSCSTEENKMNKKDKNKMNKKDKNKVSKKDKDIMKKKRDIMQSRHTSDSSPEVPPPKYKNKHTSKKLKIRLKKEKEDIRRTIPNKEDFESLVSTTRPIDSESEVCFVVNSAEVAEFNRNLKKKLLRCLRKGKE